MIEKKSMKQAYIENILLWMVMFIGFVTLFFFIIDYATIVRVKDNMDAISDYGARNVAINGIGNDLSTNINRMTVSGVNTVNANTSTICLSDSTSNAYQVIFITKTFNTNYKFFGNQLVSKRVVFNEVNSDTVTCELIITLSN